MENSERRPGNLLDLLQLPVEQRTRRIGELDLTEADRAKIDSWISCQATPESFLKTPPTLVIDAMQLLGGQHDAAHQDSSSVTIHAMVIGATASAPSIPGYELSGLLGQGGMGTVWRAHQTSTARDVAVKVMEPLLLASPQARTRFERELRLTASSPIRISPVFSMADQPELPATMRWN